MKPLDGQRPADLADERALVELVGRDVDRDGQGVSGGLPCRPLTAGLVRTHCPTGRMRSVASRVGMNSIGLDDAPLGDDASGAGPRRR